MWQHLGILGTVLSIAMLFRLLGKAAFHLGEQEQAVLAYTRATDISESALPAWKGLVEVFSATGDAAKAVPAYTRLVCKRAPAVSVCEHFEKALALNSALLRSWRCQ